MSNFTKVIKKFPRTFWVAITMEVFERWAWYGVFMVLAIYLTGSRDTGALGFTQTQKGSIMGVVVAILYFMPLLTGAIADKFGYKKVLLLAFGILSSGYLLMGYMTTYSSMFLIFLFVAVGAALFKPVISATITKTTDDETSSIGFGLFYMMVNVGGFIGPLFASKLRAYDWKYVFIMASLIILVNFILVIFFYKEPKRTINNDSLIDSVTKVVKNIFVALSDYKLVIFLVIMVGFWTLLNQLYYAMPVFIDQWMDTKPLYNDIAAISEGLAKAIGSNGIILPEMITNLDAAFIVMFQIVVSTFVMRFKPLNAMIGGIIIGGIGFSLSYATANPIYGALGIIIFSFGEMASSPKFTEYVGKIAPEGKEALYMGTSFLPVAAGNYFAGLISGPVYQTMSDKVTLLQREVAARGLTVPEVSETFSQNDYMANVASQLQMTNEQLTQYLWNTYHPNNLWYLIGGISLTTVVLLYIYDKFILKSKK